MAVEGEWVALGLKHRYARIELGQIGPARNVSYDRKVGGMEQYSAWTPFDHTCLRVPTHTDVHSISRWIYCIHSCHLPPCPRNPTVSLLIHTVFSSLILFISMASGQPSKRVKRRKSAVELSQREPVMVDEEWRNIHKYYQASDPNVKFSTSDGQILHVGALRLWRRR